LTKGVSRAREAPVIETESFGDNDLVDFLLGEERRSHGKIRKGKTGPGARTPVRRKSLAFKTFDFEDHFRGEGTFLI